VDGDVRRQRADAEAGFAEGFDPQTAEPNDEPVRLALGTFETIGTLVKHGLLSGELVKDWMWIEGSGSAWDPQR